MQSSSEQPLVGEERYVTTRITAAKETSVDGALLYVNEGLVTILHSFTFLISNFCHIYRVKIFKFTVQFPIPCLELFLCRTCALIYLFSNALVNTSQTSLPYKAIEPLSRAA